MKQVSLTHALILPSFNSGAALLPTVTAALQVWSPVFVVIDGSDDGSDDGLTALQLQRADLIVLRLPRNQGKGAAVLCGARLACDRGFTHALVMDADGQHSIESIANFMSTSKARPDALVLGRPVFPPNVPKERLHGRKLSVVMVWLEILGCGIDDPLFGFRVYPLSALLAALERRRTGRRYDFDTEAAVRLVWAGVPALNLPAPVRYPSRSEGGISHFRYGRDNARLVGMHVRLLVELILWRWLWVCRARRKFRGAEVPRPRRTYDAANS